ncbi:MAG: hypothetical protein JXA22_02285 [Candidatus Thermoplasmatota archaeon]|nr:hypothetical protein [Candidatus Thermoplasmatota archaeon]
MNTCNISGLIDLAPVEQAIDTLRPWDVGLLLPSLVLMGLAYRNWWRISPLLRGAGAILFGSYWMTQGLLYLDPGHMDVVNGVLALLGFAFFCFVAWHCYLDHRWEEDTRSLAWLSRTAFMTGAVYFILEHIPFTQGFMIYVVAWMTYAVLVIFGHDVSMQSGFPMGVNEGLVIFSGDPGDMAVRIVFACTAALAMFLFTAAILATDTDKSEWMGWARKELRRTGPSFLARSRRNGIRNIMRMSDKERKWRAFLYVVPVIFLTNIFRNVGVISVTYGGIMSFYDAHNIYAKVLSLVMMVFLTWVLFEMLPELQEDMMGLFDLFKRVRRGMMVNGRLDLKYIGKKQQ